MANTITGYKNTGIRVSRNSSAEIGTDWDRDTYTIGQRMDYGNTLNGTALTGQTVDTAMGDTSIRIEYSTVAPEHD